MPGEEGEQWAPGGSCRVHSCYICQACCFELQLQLNSFALAHTLAASALTEHRLLPGGRLRARLPLLVPPLLRQGNHVELFRLLLRPERPGRPERVLGPAAAAPPHSLTACARCCLLTRPHPLFGLSGTTSQTPSLEALQSAACLTAATPPAPPPPRAPTPSPTVSGATCSAAAGAQPLLCSESLGRRRSVVCLCRRRQHLRPKEGLGPVRRGLDEDRRLVCSKLRPLHSAADALPQRDVHRCAARRRQHLC